MFTCSFFLYIFPVDGLLFLVLKQSPSTLTTLVQTSIVTTLVVFYLQSSSTFYPLKLFVYEGIGIGFISFWIVNIALLLNLITPFNSTNIGYISIFVILGLATFSFAATKFIVVKKLNVRSNKVKNEIDLVFISDVHLGTNSQTHLKKIIAKIQQIKPEIVLIGGDLIDSSSFDFKKLTILQELDIPIYFITGNHEHYLRDYEQKMRSLKKSKITFLDNRNVTYKELNIIGLTDDSSDLNKIESAKKMVDESLYNVCLVHQPSIWDELCTDIDIMLSGHTHNGQIFPFNLLVKIKFKYIFGLYKRENKLLYVSSGSGTWGPKMRLGSLNEIISLKLCNEDKNNPNPI